MTLGAMLRVENGGESEEGKRTRLEMMRRRRRRRRRRSGQLVDEKGFEQVL